MHNVPKIYTITVKNSAGTGQDGPRVQFKGLLTACRALPRLLAVWQELWETLCVYINPLWTTAIKNIAIYNKHLLSDFKLDSDSLVQVIKPVSNTTAGCILIS